MDRQTLGRRGEAAAAKYYLDRGWTLLDHNYRTRQGELDLVLRRDDVLVIAEVKTRTSQDYGLPCEAVGPAKQRRLILAAGSYLAEKGLGELTVRFDVVEVLRGEKSCQIHCIPGAFECE